MRTLYVTDLDGTLLSSDGELSSVTEQILTKLISEGTAVTFATGRTEATAFEIVRKVPFRLPAILMNGAVVKDVQTGGYLQKYPVSISSVQMIKSLWKEYGVSGFVYRLTEDGLMTYYERLDSDVKRDFVEERRRKFRKPFSQVDSFEDLPSEDTVYFCLLDSEEKLKPVADALRESRDIGSAFYRNIYHPGMWFLETYNASGSKYNAVRFLQNYLSPEETVGFGDNLNDLPLFEACDRCYAVANADAVCKERATGVIGGNDEDGVARFLEKEGKRSEDVKENSL